MRDMKPAQAEELIRREVASGSVVAQAFLVLLADAELQQYRSTARSTDPITTATLCGRAQGVQHIINRIVLTAQPAPEIGPSPL